MTLPKLTAEDVDHVASFLWNRAHDLSQSVYGDAIKYDQYGHRLHVQPEERAKAEEEFRAEQLRLAAMYRRAARVLIAVHEVES